MHRQATSKRLATIARSEIGRISPHEKKKKIAGAKFKKSLSRNRLPFVQHMTNATHVHHMKVAGHYARLATTTTRQQGKRTGKARDAEDWIANAIVNMRWTWLKCSNKTVRAKCRDHEQ
jgi:hypothetical protein